MACFLGGDTIAAAAKKIGHNFGGLKGIHARLEKLAAKGEKVGGRELLRNDAIVRAFRNFEIAQGASP
jgi:hypothetical protein